MNISPLNLLKRFIPPPPPFSNKVVSQFQETIAPYKYSKRELVANCDNFSVTHDGENFILKGFYPNPNSKEGICEELTYKAGKELTKKFGKNYLFVPIITMMQRPYIMTHWCLLAMKNTKETALKVRDKLRLSQKLPINTDLSPELFNAVKLDDDIIRNSIIIDPSFKIIERDLDPSFQSFIPRSLGLLNPYRLKHALHKTTNLDIPLGFLDYYRSESKVDGGKSMCFLKLKKTIDGIQAYAAVALENNPTLYVFNTEKHLPQGSILRKFIDFINSNNKN